MRQWLPRLVARIRASVYTKLLAAFLFVVVLLFAASGVALRQLNEVNQRAEDMVQRCHFQVFPSHKREA